MPSRHHLARKSQRAATAVKRVAAAGLRRKNKAKRIKKLAAKAK